MSYGKEYVLKLEKKVKNIDLSKTNDRGLKLYKNLEDALKTMFKMLEDIDNNSDYDLKQIVGNGIYWMSRKVYNHIEELEDNYKIRVEGLAFSKYSKTDAIPELDFTADEVFTLAALSYDSSYSNAKKIRDEMICRKLYYPSHEDIFDSSLSKRILIDNKKKRLIAIKRLMDKGILTKHERYYIFNSGAYQEYLKSIPLSEEAVNIICQKITDEVFNDLKSYGVEISEETIKSKIGKLMPDEDRKEVFERVMKEIAIRL